MGGYQTPESDTRPDCGDEPSWGKKLSAGPGVDEDKVVGELLGRVPAPAAENIF